MTTLDQATLQSTLITVFNHAMPVLAQDRYRLVGTSAALLQGVLLPAGDIDLLMKERSDVDAFNSAMSSFECLQPPIHLVERKQYYANYVVNGIEVGISTVEWETASDGIECFGSGPWEHYTLVSCGPYDIPTVALELRLISELYRDRPDRYMPLIEYLREHGCDRALVRRGMKERGFSQENQEEFLVQLQKASVSME